MKESLLEKYFYRCHMGNKFGYLTDIFSILNKFNLKLPGKPMLCSTCQIYQRCSRRCCYGKQNPKLVTLVAMFSQHCCNILKRITINEANLNKINLEVLLLFTFMSQTSNHYSPEQKFKTLKKNVFFADFELIIYLNLVNQKVLLYFNSSFLPETRT